MLAMLLMQSIWDSALVVDWEIVVGGLCVSADELRKFKIFG